MKKIGLIVLFSFTLLVFNTAIAQHLVGHTSITFQDASRSNRNIPCEIYYPANTAGNNVPAVQDSFPVIVFGHGFVMAYSAYQNLWEEFVPRGYIMVFPTTEGNLLSTDHQKFGWDLQFLVTELQNEGANLNSILFGVVAPETALMGHSMGGGASFLAADSLVTNGNQNLKTLIGLAPAESTSNGVSSINSAKSVTVPAVVLSGSKDGVTPPGDHHIPMYDSLASNCKTFIDIIDGWHCLFAEVNFNCDFGEGTSSAPGPISRSEQHQITYDFLNPWLDYTLKYDCNAFDQFNDSLNNSSRVNHNQQCYSNATPNINYSNGQLTSTVTGVSYQWYLNGNPIAGANQVSYTPTQQGNYTVEVFFQDTCTKISPPYSFISTGVSEWKKDRLTIYPNPAMNHIRIEGLKGSEVMLFTLQGKQISVSFIGEDKLDLSRITPGVYFLKIDGQHYKIQKL